jgi:hypothetical protein
VKYGGGGKGWGGGLQPNNEHFEALLTQLQRPGLLSSVLNVLVLIALNIPLHPINPNPDKIQLDRVAFLMLQITRKEDDLA